MLTGISCKTMTSLSSSSSSSLPFERKRLNRFFWKKRRVKTGFRILSLTCGNLRRLHHSKNNHRKIIVIGQIIGSGQIDSFVCIKSIILLMHYKTLNRNIFRSIYINLYRKKIVIKNKLSISYQRGKSMHYPESPKVTLWPVYRVTEAD